MRARLLLAVAALVAPASVLAYTYPGNSNATNDGRPEWPGGTFTWRFNADTSDALTNVQDGSDPRGAIQAAFARYPAESAATSTQGSDSATQEAGNDGVNLITFIDTAANRATVGGALAVCVFTTNGSNGITGADIVFSPTFTWSTTGSPSNAIPISSVATHEIGHWHGLAHSAVVGATMNPTVGSFNAVGNSELVAQTLSPDDRAGINLSYPDPVFAAATGTIAGSVTENGSPVFFAHVVAENVVTGVAVAGNFTLGSNQGAKHGKYEITGLPPGAYRVYAEPMDGPVAFSNLQQGAAGSWYATSGNSTPDTTFLTTVAASNAVVVAGATTTVNIAVTAGTPAVDLDTTGSGTISCPRPPMTGFSFGTGTPVAVPPGFSGALYVQGLGLENVSATLSISDPLILLDPTCVRRSGAGATASVLLPMTVPAGLRPGPRTIWLTMPGGEVGACTGCLEIEGPETEAGACSNGVDDDGDGLTDNADIECFSDLCPGDPLKTSPGQCGCGVPDTDSDADGTANCVDGCPSDGAKTAAGQCGCGVPDTDTDGDGTANCNDGCPSDPAKVAGGQCGCGVADTDTDGDGTANCNDACPSDPAKAASAGTCGCGVAETDTDGDGSKDCVDACDADPAKTAAGACGCGVPDTDTDGDGTADCNDNCPSTPNADQADVNGNGIGDACESLALRADRSATPFGASNVPVRIYVDADAGLCLSRAFVRIGFDGGTLTLTGADGYRTGCAGTLTPVSAGEATLEVTCSPGFQGGGALSTLRFTVPGSGTAARYAIALSDADADDCDAPANALAPTSFDGSLTVGCKLGDISPEGAGDGSIGLSDFVLARRKALGTVAETAFDHACGDVHPGQVTCQRGAGTPSNWCATGDSDIKTGDVVVLRRRVSNVYAYDCAGCVAQLGRDPSRRLAGDIGPGDGDGAVTIADAVRALRASVGLESAAGESLLRGDVAPADELADGRLAVRGDGRIGVADAVLILRASVGLGALAWPEREIAVVLEGPAAVAWRAVVTGWPAWAEPSGFEGPGCDDVSGLDASGGEWSSTCALDGELAGPHSARWRYRAPEPVAPSGLVARGESVSDGLVESSAPVVIVAP